MATIIGAFVSIELVDAEQNELDRCNPSAVRSSY